MSELKHCPFCGALAAVKKDGEIYTIECRHPTTCYLYLKKNRPKFFIREAAIKQWNRRADDD